jgi:alkanesulfonate monooxygenase SsuD/methylene tetrahydromethanopterin reductase-like flavin-dependent oxidoreductase (luciferase family)
MRIGVTLPFGASDGPGRLPTWREMHAFAAHSEAIGLDSLWACDHLLSGSAGRPAEVIHESWTIVAALAASTSAIELGQLVMCVSFRSPALLAKMAVTADGGCGPRWRLEGGW